MNRCVFLGVFLFFFCHVNAFEIGWNIYTYFITTPDGKNMTLYITPESEITIQGKAYMPFSGYFTNNTEENYVENLIMLRRDGAQYFCYDSKTESEHLMFDFGLQKGDSYIDGFNNIEYEVTDVRDTLLYEQNLQLIELQSKGGEGKRDIWVESIGSIYKGILPTNDYCKEMHLLINEYNEEPLDCLYRFYPNNQYIKTADMDITYLQWEKELETDEDWEEYMAWYNAPTDLNAEFSGDTLHVWGRLRASGGLYPYAACEIQGDMVSLCFFSNVYLEGICIDEIDTRIPGFQKGEYLVNLINKTEELECAGTITAQEPSPFLEGNPIWVYKHEHLSRGTAWKDEVCYGCFVDTNDKKYNYYFLGGQKEIEGKVYTMMGEVKNDGENDLAVSRWLPVREENGIVYAFTDSLPGLIDYDYLEPPYLQQGNECVLYNFSAEIGDLLYPQKDYTKVESYGTYQLMDGIVCRVLKTTIEEFDLYEKLGYLHNGLYNGVMDPPSDLIYSTGGDVYASHLNAYFGNDMMLYKAPDAQEGLCVNDTCWTRDDAEAYAPSYKPDPRQEEVFSYIRQLQKANEPVAYFPEGTKWTEIRLDTLKYNSWYSKVGDEWVPNFETIEYYMQGEYIDEYGDKYKCVYTNGPEWTDSLTLLLLESGQIIQTTVIDDDDYVLCPGTAYQFDWSTGMRLWFQEILEANATCFPPCGLYNYGMIDEIKEGNFGGVRPLKYVDLNGKAPSDPERPWLDYADTNGGRIIQGIGITEWNDGECLFGPLNPYEAVAFYNAWYFLDERHYRSMLVHFERNDEVLYDVWPEKETIMGDPVTYTAGQMATIILPTPPDASKGKYYRLDRYEDGQIVFEQELEPQAHVPYIIVPNEDFSIDLRTLDLTGLSRDTVSIAGISFIGSYVSETFDYPDGFYIDFIDITPDCRFEESCVIGALRAYLLVQWDDPYNQGGTRVPPLNKMGIVLRDYETGITSSLGETGKGAAIYNLAGQQIAKSQKGINIIRMSDGTTRKILIK